MEQQLRVGTAAEQMMVARWRGWATDLDTRPPPPGLGLPCQASAAAVDDVHGAIAVAAAALARRVQASATKVSAADTCYLANEASSAAQLAAVSAPETGL
jgi:hypothetical protein